MFWPVARGENVIVASELLMAQGFSQPRSLATRHWHRCHVWHARPPLMSTHQGHWHQLHEANDHGLSDCCWRSFDRGWTRLSPRPTCLPCETSSHREKGQVYEQGMHTTSTAEWVEAKCAENEERTFRRAKESGGNISEGD